MPEGELERLREVEREARDIIFSVNKRGYVTGLILGDYRDAVRAVAKLEARAEVEVERPKPQAFDTTSTNITGAQPTPPTSYSAIKPHD